MSTTANLRLNLLPLREQLARLRRDVAGAGGEVDDIVHDMTEAAATELRSEYARHSVTGTLASRVRTRYPGVGIGIVSSAAPHASIFEDGTSLRRTKSGANRGRMPAARVIARVAVEQRRRMVARLVALLQSHGLEVK